MQKEYQISLWTDVFQNWKKNVNEWSDDKPLTDIIVGDGWSINRILKEYPWIDFIQALFVLHYYKEGGYYSPDLANLFFKK